MMKIVNSTKIHRCRQNIICIYNGAQDSSVERTEDCPQSRSSETRPAGISGRSSPDVDHSDRNISENLTEFNIIRLCRHRTAQSHRYTTKNVVRWWFTVGFIMVVV
jgi:hypothetical protein